MSEIPPAVHWHEGMLLAQQHLQLTARRTEVLMQRHASLISPFHYGLTNIRKDLQNGVLSVSNVEGLLPDGLVIRHDEVLTIDLKEWAATTSPNEGTIYLKAPAWKPGERFKQRYRGEQQLVVDDDTGQNDLLVPVLRPKVWLELTHRLSDDYVGFPIAKVAARRGGIDQIDFEPPWLQVDSSTAIYALCSRIAGKLREKAESLAARSERVSASSHPLALLQTRMLIHSLVSALPPLWVLLDSETAHPFDLYLALASIYGNLAPGMLPERVAAYDHNDLLRVFKSLESAIEATIKSAVHAPYEIYPFTAEADCFRLRIEPAWVQGRMFLGVRRTGGAAGKDIDDWVVQSTIGTEPKIDGLRERRVTGWKRTVAKKAMPPDLGVTLYSLYPPDDDLPLCEVELIVTSSDQKRRPDEVLLYVDTEK